MSIVHPVISYNFHHPFSDPRISFASNNFCKCCCDDKPTKKLGNQSQMGKKGEKGTQGKEVGKRKEDKVVTRSEKKVGETKDKEETHSGK
jgi:hypothetical protein